MHSSDPSALLRTDSALSLPFFSACAAALSEQGLLSDIESDSLRISLKDKYRRIGESDNSLFTELLREGGTLISLMQARSGVFGFNRLYVSWTIAQTLEKTTAYLDEFATGLLKKAELMFNQTFYFYQNGSCEQQTIFSAFLVEAAEHIHDSREDFHQLLKEFRYLYPSTPRSSESGTHWEKALSLHLNYQYGQGETLAQLKIEQAFKILLLRWELLADRMRYITEKVKDNIDASGVTEQMLLSLEDWMGQLAEVRSYPFVSQGSWERLERHRLRLLASLVRLQDLLQNLGETLLEILRPSRICSRSILIWPESERREVVTTLLSQGVSPAEANRAVELLEQYCKQHQVAPHLLLSTELQRIHPTLGEVFLQNLQKLAMDRNAGLPLTEEKQRVLQRKDSLLRTIQGQLLLWLLVTTYWFGGCGFRTDPQSEILDLRPSVPYHAEQRQPLPQQESESEENGAQVGGRATPTP